MALKEEIAREIAPGNKIAKIIKAGSSHERTAIIVLADAKSFLHSCPPPRWYQFFPPNAP
jgi:hypothetical protein